MLAVGATFIGLALLPARVVVEARGTVQTLSGGSDTAVVVVTAPFDGAILSIKRGSGEPVKTGDILAVMDTSIIAELHTSFVAELAAADAELLVAQTRADAEEIRAQFERTRAGGDLDIAKTEAAATGGMRDPLFADEFRHRRDAAKAFYTRSKSRLETIKELRRLGAVSDRAVADAEADATRTEAEFRAAEVAFQRSEAPFSDTMSAPRRHQAIVAANLAAITDRSTRSNFVAAKSVVLATEMRVRKIEVELDRIKGYLARAVIIAPRSGVVALTPGVEEGVAVGRGQPIIAVAPSDKRIAVAEVPEWAYTAFAEGSNIIARPAATDRVVISGRVLSRGFIIFEKMDIAGPVRFATAQVEFDTAPIPLPPGSTVMMESTHARGPLIWVLAKMITAPQNAKFALGW